MNNATKTETTTNETVNTATEPGAQSVPAKTEWIAIMQHSVVYGKMKIAYRSPVLLAKGLRDQTRKGWVVASVEERERVTYADE